QGTEIWDLSLVDPDNRRPVDFEVRKKLLESLETITAEEVMRREEEGLPKLWVITRALRLLDRLGAYVPMEVAGEKRNAALAFSRGDVITVVPICRPTCNARWGDTRIDLPEDKQWRNVLTGDETPGGAVLMADLFKHFPVALLAAS